jgi:outer membrane protein assembly factor BamB
MSGDLLMLADNAETVALHMGTDVTNGEVAWQVSEQGQIYIAPYMHGERLVSVRKLPFSVTVRYRATGRLIGRLQLPDLTLFEGHPLDVGEVVGPKALPHAHHKNLLMLTDRWYYIAVDVDKLTILWKRLVDENDVSRPAPMRFSVNEKYFMVLKENFDTKVVYMLSSQTGTALWHTNPKDRKTPPPFATALLDGEHAYGISYFPGQGYYLVGYASKTGKRIFRTTADGYNSKPQVQLLSKRFGDQLVVRVQDRQDFDMRVFDAKKGKQVHRVQMKGMGTYGIHGRVSATVQNGRTVLLSKDQVKF